METNDKIEPSPAPAGVTTDKKTSVVDTVFDVVTGWAVDGLHATKRGLEASARWLDSQAKTVDGLAQKLATSKPEGEKQAA